MRWFKHLSTARNDEDMAELLDVFGPSAYGVWWIILEIIAEQMDKTDKCSVRYSLKKWSKSCGISAKKFQKIASFLSKIEKLSFVKCEKNSDFFIIECPNLLKYRDEYSKKSGQSQDNDRTNSGETPEQETETETETETDIKKKKSKKKKVVLSPLSDKDLFLMNLPKDIQEGYQQQVVESKVDDMINYCQATGKKYKDYYAALRNWLKKDTQNNPKDDGSAAARKRIEETNRMLED